MLCFIINIIMFLIKEPLKGMNTAEDIAEQIVFNYDHEEVNLNNADLIRNFDYFLLKL